MSLPSERIPARRFGQIEIDPGRRIVTVSGAVVPLTATEFDLFLALSARPNVLMSKQDIYSEIILTAHDLESPLLRVVIYNLRSKLGSARNVIQTVRGRGYFFAPELHSSSSSGEYPVKRSTVRKT